MCFCSNKENYAYLTTNTSTLHVHLSVYHFVYVCTSPNKLIYNVYMYMLNRQSLAVLTFPTLFLISSWGTPLV